MKILRSSLAAIISLGLVHCAPPRHDRPARSTPRARPPERVLTSSARVAGDATPSTDQGPLSHPNELPPLDRSVLIAAKDRLPTPEARAHNRWIMDQLWTTTLGQNYLAYLTDDTPSDRLPGRTLDMLDLVYGQGKHTGKRLKAIEAFTLDLVGRNQMTNEMLQRSFILQVGGKVRETDGMDNNSNNVTKLAIVGLAAATILASPSARTELNNLRKLLYRRCTFRSCEQLPGVDWRRMVNHREFVNGYSLTMMGIAFATVAGNSSMVYSFLFEKLPGFLKYHDLDRAMLNGREDLLLELEF